MVAWAVKASRNGRIIELIWCQKSARHPRKITDKRSRQHPFNASSIAVYLPYGPPMIANCATRKARW